MLYKQRLLPLKIAYKDSAPLLASVKKKKSKGRLLKLNSVELRRMGTHVRSYSVFPWSILQHPLLVSSQVVQGEAFISNDDSIVSVESSIFLKVKLSNFGHMEGFQQLSQIFSYKRLY